MSRTDTHRYEVIYDKITRHYSKGEDLPPDLADRVKRWKMARVYLLDLKPQTDYDVVKLLVDDFGISEGTAWNDVRDCKRFFASMEKTNADFDRVLLRQRILKLEHDTPKDQVKAVCHANLIKLGGYDKPEEETSGVGKQIILTIGTDPALVGAKHIPGLEAIVEKFIGDKAKRELMIEDTDFEMITDGASPTQSSQ